MAQTREAIAQNLGERVCWHCAQALGRGDVERVTREAEAEAERHFRRVAAPFPEQLAQLPQVADIQHCLPPDALEIGHAVLVQLDLLEWDPHRSPGLKREVDPVLGPEASAGQRSLSTWMVKSSSSVSFAVATTS